jgi:pyruvate dehydrogenase E1 component
MTIERGGSRIDAKILKEIERRVLWLAVRATDHHRDLGDADVGGQQADAASLVSLMTTLRFGHLRGEDSLAIGPAGSTVESAIDYLTGRTDRSGLTSQTPGLDDRALTSLFSAATRRYVDGHFGPLPHTRQVAVVRDTELEDGSVWEAIADPATRGLGSVMLVVDLNRQRLDRVVSDTQATRLKRFFTDAGWHVIEARYGHLLQAAFARPGGDALRYHIDSVASDAYQALFALSAEELRVHFLHGAEPAVVDLLEPYDDAALADLVFNLGGHDTEALLDCFHACDVATDRPSVVFAYTVKGWSLPLAGDPLNHRAVLSPAQVDALRSEVGLTPATEWDRFDPEGDAGQLCAAVGGATFDRAITASRPAVPSALDLVAICDEASSQEAFGELLVCLADLDDVGDRLVTVSSTRTSMSEELAGWMSRAGAYSPVDRRSHRGTDTRSAPISSRPGRHIELGESETNLMAMLGRLGLARDEQGELLLPIGLARNGPGPTGLDALIRSIRSGARFVLVGTSPGAEITGLRRCRPTFVAEVDWMLCDALRRLSATDGGSTHLQLSAAPIGQAPFEAALVRLGRGELRRRVLAGGYRLIEPTSVDRPGVTLVTTGPAVAEVVAATEEIESEGVATTVVHLTSPDGLYHDWQRTVSRAAAHGRHPAGVSHLESLFSDRTRSQPIVSVHDGASQALSWIGAAVGASQIPLGVDRVSGSGEDAPHRPSEISCPHIVNSALLALELFG